MYNDNNNKKKKNNCNNNRHCNFYNYYICNYSTSESNNALSSKQSPVVSKMRLKISEQDHLLFKTGYRVEIKGSIIPIKSQKLWKKTEVQGMAVMWSKLELSHSFDLSETEMTS